MGRSPGCDGNGLKKGPWTPEEDGKLVQHMNKHGHGSWRALPKLAGLNRCGKSCRLRWTNYLRPDIKRGNFSQEEEQTILNLHSILGNKWSSIATHLPGRTDNEIKNFWNTHLRRKLIQMGFDPMTHQPRTDYEHLLPTLIALASLRDNLMINMHSPQIRNHADPTLHYLPMIQCAASTNNSSHVPQSANYNDNMDDLTNFLNSNHDHDLPISPLLLPQPQVHFSPQPPNTATTLLTQQNSEENNYSGSFMWSSIDPSPALQPADNVVSINPGDASSTTTSSYGGGQSYWPQRFIDDYSSHFLATYSSL